MGKKSGLSTLLRLTPLKVFLTYTLVIFISTFFYFYIPEIFEEKITISDSLYFSVVTITTLGYGDLSPISNCGKTIAALEALLGVILIGIFLLAVSNQLIEKEEKKRIDAAKENIKAQYNAWKHDIMYSLLFLLEPDKGVDSDLPNKLTDVNEFKEYFKEDNSSRWHAIASNLSSDSYYSNEVTSGLEALQHHIETFISVARISDPHVLMQLTDYINQLRWMRKRNLDEYDDQKVFMRNLWSILAQWDFMTGHHHRDILLEAINNT